jgi:transcriptional regulator of acetoin/glycerol metabolism
MRLFLSIATRRLFRLATSCPVHLFRFGTVEELKRTAARNVLYQPQPGGSRQSRDNNRAVKWEVRMLLSAEDRLSRARVVLTRRGVAAGDLLPAPIADSWTRCLAAGLDPANPPPPQIADETTLREARQRRDLLRRLTLAEMDNLYHQIAGSNFMIAFAAADGMLLDAITDQSFSATAGATRIQPGTLWAETLRGTNALGTVAQTGKPITVHGAEHFFACYGALTCIAAPVFDAEGALAGVLDASSDCRSRQQHTAALVSMAATQIENGLFRECHRTDVLLSLHNRAEYLHTLNAGMLAIDPGGMVLAANTQARFLLQGLPVTRGRRLEELFRTRFEDLLQASRDNERVRLEDRVGSVFAARLENVRVVRPVVVPAIASPPSAPRPSVSPTGFVAEDTVVAASLRQLETAARRGLPTLLSGETGTGKEQFARHAHTASGRTGAFVAVNCAALPDSLAEAELFGHTDGAFTGARRGGAPGLVQEADGGTLFLDEIGAMKLPLQAVLLRLLDDWVVRPVGGGRRRQVDVLLLAATNVDLSEAAAAGQFRADLLYRLNTIEIVLPPLRARSDFASIVRHLLGKVAPGWQIDDTAIAALQRLPWFGNIRELRTVLTRATLVGTAGTLDVDAIAGCGQRAQEPTQQRPLREMLHERIRAVHRGTAGNVSETARRLRVSRNTVYRALANSSGGPA